MRHEVLKIENRSKKECHLNVFPREKKVIFPSCYHYNILIMLAKRLIEKDRQKELLCKSRLSLDKKLTKRIVSA